MPSNPATELAAILTGAAIAPLDDRAFLRVTGADATRWLNGMVTNSILSLAPGEGNYNFLLNAQGRIQGDCTIYRDGDSFLLETQHSQLETVHQTLDRFIIMDDVELTPALEDRKCLLILGPRATGILHSAADCTMPRPGHLVHAGLNGHEAIVIAPPATIVPAYELWFSSTLSLEHSLRTYKTSGAVPISAQTLEAFRILSGTPRYGTDIRDKDLPQETAQTHALHFTKGCYLGQEIVERIHSRGQVHRTFTGFRLTALPATLPMPLTAYGKPIGELTSAAILPLPEGNITFALGYARREALDRNQPLHFEGGTATPTPLPFHPSSSPS